MEGQIVLVVAAEWRPGSAVYRDVVLNNLMF